MSASEDRENWDSYPCQVDDRPGSIFLNLDLAAEHPPFDTMYFAAIELLEPAEHGMGSEAEAEFMGPLQDGILEGTQAAGLCYVGRLRNNSIWQLALYGEAGRESDLERVVSEALKGGKRRFQVGSGLDPEWSYYHGFLYPNAERWQWMQDRKVVEALARNGDAGQRPREVDHWVGFEGETSRAAFVASAKKLGFSARDLPEPKGGLYLAQVVREDPVLLEHIHQVVMELIDLAEQNSGTYDGWESPVRST